MHFSSVLLPEPLRPTIPKNSPRLDGERNVPERVEPIPTRPPKGMQSTLLQRVAAFAGEPERLGEVLDYDGRRCPVGPCGHEPRVALGPMLPPPSVSVDLSRATLREYSIARAAQHTRDSYAGVPMSKFPEDLRAYEHLLWLTRPSTVLELGVQFGGSSPWFRDRLRTLARYGHIERPRVIGIEIDASSARAALDDADPDWEQEITLIEADVRDPKLPDHVAEMLDPSERVLVIEDTEHTYETTLAALTGFSRFVPDEGFFIVEDGRVDQEDLRLPFWPRGVLPAIEDWLRTPEGPGPRCSVNRCRTRWR